MTMDYFCATTSATNYHSNSHSLKKKETVDGLLEKRLRTKIRRCGAKRIGWQSRVVIAAPVLFGALLLFGWSHALNNNKADIKIPSRLLFVEKSSKSNTTTLVKSTTKEPYELKHILFYKFYCKKLVFIILRLYKKNIIF